uniref:Protein spaetzle n=1 Tax=Cacopsylla melanoneura TaxID=428564 RepID=A0A8D8ZML9_9HEMI
MKTLLRTMWMNTLSVKLIRMGIFLYLFTSQSYYVSSAQKTTNGSAVDNRSTTAGSPKTFAFETHTSKYSQRFQGSKGKINRSKVDTGTVVFPDEIEEEEEDALPSRTSGSLLGQKKNKKPNQLESCGKGSTICERFDDYPKDILKDILAKKIGKNYQATIDVGGNSFLIPEDSTSTNPVESPDAVVRTRINDIFSEKTKPKISPKVPGQDVLSFGIDQLDDTSIKNRIGSTEEYLCHSTPQVKFLHGAESKDGNWKLIVNDDDKFVQGVRVEQCSRDNAPCKYADHFPPNLSAKCAQKYIYRRLVAFNKETKELFNDEFKIPSCCVCVVSRLAHGDDSAERRSLSANAPEPLALTAVKDDDYMSKK